MRTILPKHAILVPNHAQRVFKGHLYDVYQWEETMFDGSKGAFEMLKRDDTVEMIVVNDDKVLIQYQEQPHLGHFTSFPGGRHDHTEETELDTAKRELKEETGYVCSNWTLLDVTQPNGKIEQFIYTFLASHVTEHGPMHLDSGERIENKWVTLEEFRTLITQTNFRTRAQKFLEPIEHLDELFTLPEYTP